MNAWRRRDIIAKRAHVLEWLTYCDYNVKTAFMKQTLMCGKTWSSGSSSHLQKRFEKKIKRSFPAPAFTSSNSWTWTKSSNTEKISSMCGSPARPFWWSGGFFKDILTHVQGAISIGPFACMPTRVIEAVLSAESTMENKRLFDRTHGLCDERPAGTNRQFAVFSVESDGNPFPQIIEARIEAFCLQVERLHKKLKSEVKEPVGELSLQRA